MNLKCIQGTDVFIDPDNPPTLYGHEIFVREYVGFYDNIFYYFQITLKILLELFLLEKILKIVRQKRPKLLIGEV